MAFSYDLLPPVIPDFIQPIANTEQFFQIPIIMAETTGEEKNLKDFGIKTVQYQLIDQNNNIDQSFGKFISGAEIIKKDLNKNEFILFIPTTDSEFEIKNDIYYKLQVRFSRQSIDQINKKLINSNCFSEWSSICLLKKVKLPTVSLYYGDNLLNKNEVNTIEMSTISGIFSFTEKTETIRKYKIIINKTLTDDIIYITDWLIPTEKNQFIHNLTNHVLQKAEQYIINVKYQTSSGYEGTYQGKINISLGMLEDVFFEVQEEEKPELGEIWVKIFAHNNVQQNFLIQRSSSIDGFKQWEDVAIVQFKGNQLNGSQQIVTIYDTDNNQLEGNWEQLIWQDKTIKSGIFYQYAISTLYKKIDINNMQNIKFNNTAIYTTGNTRYTQKQCCIFDDMFLIGDSGKSLRIKYNPTISNFKYNIQESIQNTLGSKYPFITKNGKNNYRSFSIGGLITLFMDINDRTNVPFYFYDSTNNINNNNNLNNINNIIYLNSSQTRQYSLFSSLKLGPNENETNFISIDDFNTKDLETLISLVFKDEIEQENQLKYFKTLKTDSQKNEYRNSLKNFYNQKQDKTNQTQLNNFILEKDLFPQEAYTLRQKYNKNNNITKYNDIIYEREFREAVYKFLYSDNPKLFRSNAQGNILIKLTNLSFTPVNQLGRRLYSFSADAIEIDENSITNLFKYNIYEKGTWKNLIPIQSQELDIKIQWTNKSNISLIDKIKQKFKNLKDSEIVKLKKCQIKVDFNKNISMPLVDLSSMTYINNSKVSNLKNQKKGFLLQMYTNDNGVNKLSKIFINSSKQLNLPQNVEITQLIIPKSNIENAKNIVFHFSMTVLSKNYANIKKDVQTLLRDNFLIKTISPELPEYNNLNNAIFENCTQYINELNNVKTTYPDLFITESIKTEPVSLLISTQNKYNNMVYKNITQRGTKPQILFNINKNGLFSNYIKVQFNKLYSLIDQSDTTIEYNGILTNPNQQYVADQPPESELYDNQKLFKRVPLTIKYTFKIYYSSQKNKIFI